MFTNGDGIRALLDEFNLHLEQDGIDSFKVYQHQGESRKKIGRIWARKDGVGFSSMMTDIPSALSTLVALEKHR